MPTDDVRNLSQAVRQVAAAEPDREYLVVGNRTWSYGEADRLIDRCCARFADLGLEPGDMVSAIIDNGADYVVLYMASLRFGTIFNPFPFTMEAQDILGYLEHIRPRLVLCRHSHYAKLTGQDDYPTEMLPPAFLDELPEHAGPWPMFEPGPRSPACLYYSSGTTGNPKCILFSHANMMANIRAIVEGFRFDEKERHLIVLPMGHTASINYSLLPCTLTGGSVVIAASFWSARPRFWSLIRDQAITYVEVVPSVLAALLETPFADDASVSLPALRFVGCGSSTLPGELQRRFISRFGVRVANLYGLSETGPSHVDYPLDPDWEPGSIGFPLSCNRCFIVDGDGKPLPDGEVGEIAISGPNVFIAYRGNPTLYASVVHDGAFYTGDLGRIDESGRFWFIGRKKELIIKGGVNIAPDEIDEVIYKLPGVAVALTVGKADDYLGEKIHSFIVPADGAALTEADIRTHCRSFLSSSKVPDHISFVAAIPAGHSGKFLRREMQRQAS
ncbi:class I adenylate-forming enzyme family protein [Sphingobium mellinum]|uniref:class I adenylate-forming enzyme family protein n=1 Tax=Sphingobium mellinum TaxID=1387166 RepID=UPI0030EECBFB